MLRRTLPMVAIWTLAAACGDDGGSGTTDASTSGSGTSSSTAGSTSGTSGADTTTGSTGGSTTGGSESSGGTADSTGSETTDGSSSGGSTGDTTTGGIVASFTCTETSIVDPPMVETIAGSFDADGVPHDLVAIYTQSGNVDFQVDVAVPVAADDPNAADVADWENTLTMIGWDVNPPGDPTGDRRYFFAPDGAQNVAIFPAFYYRIYEAGGNGQFEFDCVLN